MLGKGWIYLLTFLMIQFYLTHGVQLTIDWICLDILARVHLGVVPVLANNPVARPGLSESENRLVSRI